MPRKKSIFFEYVTEKGKSWKCRFCHEEYSGSVTRIKAHLANAKGFGIEKCECVDSQVRAKACEALFGKRVQDQDGARNENVPQNHQLIHTTVVESACPPLCNQHALREDAENVAWEQPQPQPQSQISYLDVVAQYQRSNGASTHQGLGRASQQPSNNEQTNTEFEVLQDLDPRTNKPQQNLPQPHDSCLARENVPASCKRKRKEFSGDEETPVAGCKKRATLATKALGDRYGLQFSEETYDLDGADITFWVCELTITDSGLQVPFVQGGSSNGRFLLLPHNVKVLRLVKCTGPIEIGRREMGQLASLDYIEVSECHDMKQVLVCEWQDLLPSLRQVKVWRCEQMEEMITGSPSHMRQPGALLSLTHLFIHGCPKMRKLFTYELAVQLRNLESLKVSCCYTMEEILGGEDKGRNSASIIRSSCLLSPSSPCRFPNLKMLKLSGLPQLKSICEGMLICDKITRISLTGCPQLERFPIELERSRELRNFGSVEMGASLLPLTDMCF